MLVTTVMFLHPCYQTDQCQWTGPGPGHVTGNVARSRWVKRVCV